MINVNFEHELRKVRNKLKKINSNPVSSEHSYAKPIAVTLPEELIYADDCDAITDNSNYETQKTKDKEVVDEPWRTVTKLGSKIDDIEDIVNRKLQSTAAQQKLNDVWIRKEKVKQQPKIEIYKTLVKPALLYNAATWGITKNDENNISFIVNNYGE